MSIKDHHDGTADAEPGGYAEQRRPGEVLFTIFLLVASLVLLWKAYGISGFEALSAPGSVPMATTLAMVVTAAIVLIRTIRLPLVKGETIAKDILPWIVVLFIGFLIAFGVLLKPLGFVPTSALFLLASIKILSGRSWAFAGAISLASLLGVWLIFRVVFTVLMPAGVFPEAEIMQFLRELTAGGGA